MHPLFPFLVVAACTVLRVQAAPQAQQRSTCTESSVAVTTPFTAPITYPTAPFAVYGYREGYDVVHQFWNADGEKFYLGGAPSTYCPEDVLNSTSGCPAGNKTVFSGLNELYVEVPGGQQVYITVEGYLGYTQAHSDYYPPGSDVIDFAFFGPGYEQHGYLTTTAFGAQGFMACPMMSGAYQIFAAFTNATVPNGNITACIGFDAITAPYDGTGPAAWQYT